jgi:pilus assembly protein FimV
MRDHAVRLCALLTCFALSAGLRAAELGELTVLSKLNQPLNAEIEILSLEPDEAQSLSAHLLGRDTTKAGVRVSIGRRDGNPIVRITSSRAVSEPYVQVRVELRSKRERQARRYAVLLDPPGYASAEPRPKPPAPRKPPTAAQKPAAKPPADSAALPLSREALFGLPAKPAAAAPSSREELFGLTEKPAPAAPASKEELFGLPPEKPAAA